MIKVTDERARVAFEELTGKSARRGKPLRTWKGDDVIRYPFTIRLPLPMYIRLSDSAEKAKRSIAAQVELDLERLYS